MAASAMSPDVEIFEVESCAEPNEAWYDPARSPTNTTSIEVLSYKVPTGRAVLLLDYTIEPYVFGLGAVSALPAPDRGLWRTLGHTLTVDGKTPGVISFDLEPVPSTNQRMAYRNTGTSLRRLDEITAGDYARTRSRRYGRTTVGGTAIMPPRTTHHGFAPGVAQWSILADEGETIVLGALIYRALPFPLAFLEGRLVGYAAPRNTLLTLLEDMRRPLEECRS